MPRRIRRNVRVRRVIRRLELWSVFKVALVCHACCYGVTLGVGTLLWRTALQHGLVGNLEKFMREIGFADDFRLDGPTLWRGAIFGGLGLFAVNVIATVMLAFFYNMVSGLLGGVVVSMLEEAPHASGVRAPIAAARVRRRRQDRSSAPSVSARAAAAAATIAPDGRNRVRRGRKAATPLVSTPVPGRASALPASPPEALPASTPDALPARAALDRWVNDDTLVSDGVSRDTFSADDPIDQDWATSIGLDADSSRSSDRS